MSTRAFIGIKLADDAIVGIYCQHDGYPYYLGQVLKNYYYGMKVWRLISLGSLDYCDRYINFCETLENAEDIAPRFHRSLAEIYERQPDFQYVYVYDPAEQDWFYNAKGDELWHPLEKNVAGEGSKIEKNVAGENRE